MFVLFCSQVLPYEEVVKKVLSEVLECSLVSGFNVLAKNKINKPLLP